MYLSRIKAACQERGIPCEEDHVLAPNTSMKIGGPCDLFVKVTDESQLSEVLGLCRSEKVPYFILGRGSNLLVSSGGRPGAVAL